jgi:hypothetical protein
MPGNSVVWHGVIEHSIHIKKHSFGAKSLKAMLVQIILNIKSQSEKS